jgi:hypothetical protein
LPRSQLRSSQHVFRGRFDHLCRNHSIVRGNSGSDRASLDPKAVSAQKPQRSALRRGRYRAAHSVIWGSEADVLRNLAQRISAPRGHVGPG